MRPDCDLPQGAWAKALRRKRNHPRRFHDSGGEAADVPTMNGLSYCGYAKRDGFTAVSIPYNDRELQFLILLPDDAGASRPRTENHRHDAGRLRETRDAGCDSPSAKIQIRTAHHESGRDLAGLGMQTAFDQPHGSANFDRLAPRKPDDYLYISAVFHKTFIAVDEEGTEAAAATAVAMAVGAARAKSRSRSK